MAEAVTTTLPSTLKTVDREEGVFDDVQTAKTGINMLLNNGFDEAFALFNKYKDDSPLMHAGYSFVFFLQALMSFEEEKMKDAMRALQETEKLCEENDSFVKSFRRKFSMRRKTAKEVTAEDRLQRRIIVADSLLYQSVLIFTNQDIPSYIKGGWHLRKAWKIYDSVHKEVCLHKKSISAHKFMVFEANLTKPPPSELGKLPQEDDESSVDNPHPHPHPKHGFQDAVVKTPNGPAVHPDCSPDLNSSRPGSSKEHSGHPTAMHTCDLSEETLSRLLGAVNFGYGTFQLCISMVPPKILKLIEFLGFEGEREVGLVCLDYTSRSQDMKAPLATLALLWYHTVLRPFFALDGADNFTGGTQEAEAIIREKENTFASASLFLFFKGRIHRLRRETDKSYELYMKAYQQSRGQRELELMYLYEICWFNLIRLNWDKCLEGFERLQRDSKWSKCYYSYLLAVCMGSKGMLQEAQEKFAEVPILFKRKNNQIELFVFHRSEKLKREKLSQELCQLLALELMFLWHALPMCSPADLQPMITVCDQMNDHKQLHLKCLLEGAIYKELGQAEMAVQCLKEALARYQGKKDDLHVPCFALFELASIYVKSPETIAMAKENLLLIKNNYKDYDFENRLSVRVNNALRQIKRTDTKL